MACDRPLPFTPADAGPSDLAVLAVSPDLVPTDPLNQAQKDAIEACLVAASCGSFGVNWCLDRLLQIEAPPVSSDEDWLLRQDLLTAVPEAWARLGHDCDRMRSDLHQPTFVLSSCESDAFCEGTTISYAPGVPAIDCAPLGGACAETTDRPGACCGRSCSPDSGTACMGDIATSCVSGVQSRIDCARYGLHCTTTPAVACDGDAGSCKFKDPVQCNGPRATYCPASHLATFDCSKTLFPSHCNRGGLYLPCRAEEHDCKTAEWATCDGNSVVVCAGGWKRKVDCGALGFRTCGTPNSGPAVCVK